MFRIDDKETAMMNFLLCGSLLLAGCTTLSQGQENDGLKLQRTIGLPKVTGKFDHFALDEAGNRLFVAATGNKSVQVIDLASNMTTGSLDGVGKPHGLAWIPKTGRLFVADGEKAKLYVYEGSPLKRTREIDLSEDADDMVYDPVTSLLYVGHGGTNAANPARVAVIDSGTLRLIADLPVASHPEGLDFDPNGDRIFVNIAETGQIAVIDGKTHTITDTWVLRNAKGNTPLAYDAADNLLLVGCRAPSQLVVLNAKTGQLVAAATSDGGADDLFYEPSTHHAYLIAGSGAIDTFTLSPDGKLQAMPATHTAAGAKTGLLVPSLNELFLGMPGASTDAAIRVYQTGKP